jgi:glyoxylase-like metal-dependent hydrolase (beta-lactamase superfamily II)
MHIIQSRQFGEVLAFQFGFGPIGKPLMSVYVYFVDGLIIDTGQRNMQKYVLESFRNLRPTSILLTHHHEDHSGNAYGLRRFHGTEVFGHSLTAEKMAAQRKIRPYQHYIWGKSEDVNVIPVGAIVESEHFSFRTVHTPGHSRDHVVYLEEKNGWLFSGDLFLGERIKFFRSDENIYDQIHSLKKMRQYDFDTIFCAHNPRTSKGGQGLKQKLQFLEDIVGRIQQLLKKGLSEKAIIKIMDPRNDRRAKLMTMGNVSFANIVRSAVRDK